MAADGDLENGTRYSQTVENDTCVKGLRPSKAYELTRHGPHRTPEETWGLMAEHKGPPRVAAQATQAHMPDTDPAPEDPRTTISRNALNAQLNSQVVKTQKGNQAGGEAAALVRGAGHWQGLRLGLMSTQVESWSLKAGPWKGLCPNRRGTGHGTCQ